MRNMDNPSYITVTYLLGVYHLNMMEWETRADGYQVTVSKQMDPSLSELEAQEAARKWAAEEGIEVR